VCAATTYQDSTRDGVGIYTTQAFHYVLVGPEINLIRFEYSKGVYTPSSIIHPRINVMQTHQAR